MIFLLAESGSSKTDWILADKHQVFVRCQTQGLNPYFVDSKHIAGIFKKEVMPQIAQYKVNAVFFYGSGCSADSSKNSIKEGILSVLNSDIFVEHDMTAAAKALFNQKAGIACILGTGSNTCLFDGKEMIGGINSLGYVLGDEGSGAYIGKKWLNAYFNNEIPDELSLKFKGKYQIQLEDVLDSVYKKPSPNKYLASFSPFLSENISDAFVQKFLNQVFTDFFEKMVFCYPNYSNYPLGFVGSISHVYQDILIQVAQKHNMMVEKIIKQPANELLKFHQELL